MRSTFEIHERFFAQRTDSIAERLERGAIEIFNPCPFPLPEGADREFLLRQQLGGLGHKDICYNPHTNQATGFRYADSEQAERLAGVLDTFGAAAARWLADLVPAYAAGWRRDRITFRPGEEATRKLRWNARNDLLHVDAFPSRPTQGWRILRLYVNLNPTEPRVWATADSFGKLLARFGRQLGLPVLPKAPWPRRVGEKILRLVKHDRVEPSDYDQFMLRFHHFLKGNEFYQDQASKRYWHFAPGTAWLLFSDGLSHAELRGQFALEHSFFINPAALSLPEEAPAFLLRRACGASLAFAA